MGRHQRAETSGLLSFLLCAIVGGGSMSLYMKFAPAIWQVSQRLFTVCSGIVAACGVVSFCIGYASGSNSFTLKRGWLVPIRRSLEILALSIVYAATAFLTSFLILNIANGIIGTQMFVGYVVGVCAGLSGIVGYLTIVQAQAMRAKTLAALLPFFVISGVGGAGMTTDDPYWFVNNFSRLGDRTTFAAAMFNTTLILAGICIIVISYFSVSELITTYRQRKMWNSYKNNNAGKQGSAGKQSNAGKQGKVGKQSSAGKQDSAGKQSKVSKQGSADKQGSAGKQSSANKQVKAGELRFARTRIVLLSILLTACGVCFIGIGSFRQTPHPILHNTFAYGLPCLTGILLVALPWLAPLFSKAMYVVSDLIVVVGVVAVNLWLRGDLVMTDLELLLIMLFFGWFIVFSRQIAAIEADRIQDQIVSLQAKVETGDSLPTLPESRLASDR